MIDHGDKQDTGLAVHLVNLTGRNGTLRRTSHKTTYKGTKQRYRRNVKACFQK